ncbi:winged helix-turn-helix domain-containing protein [Parafrankia sp. FMc2]|uniref:winged helix-turn-helix domain-containing protein n=1 Tax=Parafrankia sp. FMc2 TaxID=3233196 RepID=UPI0034D46F17
MYGWDDQRWTLARVAEVIAREFGLTYTLPGVWMLLDRHGWSCQLPARRGRTRRQRRPGVAGRAVAGGIKPPRRPGPPGSVSATRTGPPDRHGHGPGSARGDPGGAGTRTGRVRAGECGRDSLLPTRGSGPAGLPRGGVRDVRRRALGARQTYRGAPGGAGAASRSSIAGSRSSSPPPPTARSTNWWLSAAPARPPTSGRPGYAWDSGPRCPIRRWPGPTTRNTGPPGSTAVSWAYRRRWVSCTSHTIPTPLGNRSRSTPCTRP